MHDLPRQSSAHVLNQLALLVSRQGIGIQQARKLADEVHTFLHTGTAVTAVRSSGHYNETWMVRYQTATSGQASHFGTFHRQLAYHCYLTAELTLM